MGKMKEIWAMHQEGYSAEYIAEQSEITTEPFGSVEEAASYVADQAKSKSR